MTGHEKAEQEKTGTFSQLPVHIFPPPRNQGLTKSPDRVQYLINDYYENIREAFQVTGLPLTSGRGTPATPSITTNTTTTTLSLLSSVENAHPGNAPRAAIA